MRDLWGIVSLLLIVFGLYYVWGHWLAKPRKF